MFAPLLSRESDVHKSVFVVHTCFSFLYRLDSWFSRLNGFTVVNFGALYSLLFGVDQGSVLKAVP